MTQAPAKASRPQLVCRVCSSSNTHLMVEVESNQVLRCDACDHVFLNVAHTAESISTLYEDYGQQGENQYFSGMDAQVLSNIDGYLRRAQELVEVDEADQPLRLLDIGCGNGGLMQRAQEMGFDVEGVEICQPLAQIVRKRLDCRVHGCFVEDLEVDDASYDVITMYDLVEHLAEPCVDLRAVHRLLKPGGILFVLTPNDHALVRTISKKLYRFTLGRFDRPMKKLYYPDHLSYFTKKSLHELFSRTDFEVLDWSTKNQELGRLEISWLEKLAVRALFVAGDRLPAAGGKHIAYVRKAV